MSVQQPASIFYLPTLALCGGQKMMPCMASPARLRVDWYPGTLDKTILHLRENMSNVILVSQLGSLVVKYKLN